MSLKICVVITARPSYARIRTAMEAIADHPGQELQLVVSGSALLDRYGSADKMIEADGFPINRRVYSVVEGENLVTSAKATGLGLTEMATVFDDLKPDRVVTVADRYETIATAIAAAYLNIPLVHVQGGEVTGSIDEKVRHAITKLADIHFVSTPLAADRVRRMGEEPHRIFVTGCPSIDLALRAEQAPLDVHSFFQRYGGVGSNIDLEQPFIVVMQHPVTTEYQASRRHIDETLHAVRDSGIPALWFWPNVDAGSDGTSKGIRAFRENFDLPRVHFFKNLPAEEFQRLLVRSAGIVGNSSVGIRECEALGVAAINVGTRQDGRERGANVREVDYDRGAIRAEIEQMLTAKRPAPGSLYGTGKAGMQIAELLGTVAVSTEKRLTY